MVSGEVDLTVERRETQWRPLGCPAPAGVEEHNLWNWDRRVRLRSTRTAGKGEGSCCLCSGLLGTGSGWVVWFIQLKAPMAAVEPLIGSFTLGRRCDSSIGMLKQVGEW